MEFEAKRPKMCSESTRVAAKQLAAKRLCSETTLNLKDKLSKLLDFKKFDMSELDCIFRDFKTTFDQFVQNREDMAKAEESFKKAVTTLEQISPHAQFSEYVHALKTRLTSEGTAVKIKEGALAIYTEDKKTV